MEFVSPPLTVRRNPPRKAKTPASRPPEVLIPSSSSATDRPPLRPIQANLQSPPSVEEVQKPFQKKPSESPADEDTLRVFLRIRPPKESKTKKNAACTRRRSKEEGDRVCLIVNDSRSVTLTAPASLVDPKRIKNETFDGFSHVFQPESSQVEVYGRVMQPLVLDFLGGSSRLLVAMGPTGSGKTHTVFGAPDKPGLVPLALKELFRHSSIYYISMFEISSEQGRGERIYDLLQGGNELSLQQSSCIRGLQEFRVENIAQAESTISRGMLRRTTAATNANSQSSRSQCITNIRRGSELVTGDDTSEVAVLTVADLAGAERERRTGNQGKRLLQSGFINNTSMVLGQCLRAILEHQQNRKKQLQKHFHCSLLTRYLREYMEAKKRMALILTAGPTEDDYGDTSFLLRQASPYMRIRFDNMEERKNVDKKKRQIGALYKSELPKRRKCNDLGSNMMVQVCGGSSERDDSHKDGSSKLIEPIAETSCVTAGLNSDINGSQHVRNNDLRNSSRIEHAMPKFCRALWTVLKEYKEKLVASENALNDLKANFEKERSRVLEMEKELLDLKASCTCTKISSSVPNPVEVDSIDFCCNSQPNSLGALPHDANVARGFSVEKEMDEHALKVTPTPSPPSPCPNAAHRISYDVNSGYSAGQAGEISFVMGSTEATVTSEGAVDEIIDGFNAQPNGAASTELQSSLNHEKLLQKQYMTKDKDGDIPATVIPLMMSSASDVPFSESSSHSDAVAIACEPCLSLTTESASICNSDISSNECAGPIGRLLEELTGITMNDLQKGLWKNDKHCMSKISALANKYGEKIDKMDSDTRWSKDESYCLRYCFALIHKQALENEGIKPKGETRTDTSRQEDLHAIAMASSVARAMHHVKILETKKTDCSNVHPDVDKPRRRLLPASSMLKHANCFSTEDGIIEDGFRGVGRKKAGGNEKMGTQGRMELIRLLKGSQPM
ncbi:kinesin-like protein KIN-6 isoform X1 [Nymphaea colorata]|uniref:kinesin-like protein KIN-6 isoform X1 n=1 Tax=Nymphaea colorata TaxID=210225 RepID=UPI00129DB2DB|nr:kinesin-like protein KIN-6 isoform X1 [Nymphaea colorata]